MVDASPSRAALVLLTLCASSCASPADVAMSGQTTTTTGTVPTSESGETQAETSDTNDTNDTNDTSHYPDLDSGWEDTGTDPCSECNKIDLLIVVDNSGTMGDEQLALGPGLSAMLDGIKQLKDADGQDLHPDVNIMVTSTDLGGPMCDTDLPAGYEPLRGAPQDVACINRLEDFTSRGPQPTAFEDACTLGCPVPAEPADPHIHFEGFDGIVTNVPGNNVDGALRCLAPQGINGCGYEAPLEAMLQAINPAAEWNQGAKPFLRDGAILAIVIVTDEYDCSIRSPDGYAFFVSNDSYWEVDPDTMTKTGPTSAVCWNAGVDCGMPDMNGVYPDCTSLDTGVLHPVSRYRAYLVDELMGQQNKDVVMLGIVGVPHVTGHLAEPPFVPNAGGVENLVYREWSDAPYPLGDLLPGDIDAAHARFEHGAVAPGCMGVYDMGNVITRALPPVRVRELCESLDDEDFTRCSLESVCDEDHTAAFAGLVGMMQFVIDPLN